MNKGKRIGGLQVDPAVLEWQQRAAENKAALTAKQRKDRARVRVKYDLPPALKEAIEEEAGKPDVDTSASQFAMFLLSFALKEYRSGNAELLRALDNARQPARTMRFSFNLLVPNGWQQFYNNGDA